jgi:hypothetical protein
MKNKIRLTMTHIAAAVIVTVIMLLIYVSVQQNYRMNANDPQIQLTQDISNRLASGRPIAGLIPADSFDIAYDLSPFVILYNAQGNPLHASATLNGSMPKLPAGVFDYVKKHGEDRITWQPKQGVRMAMVVKYANIYPVSFVAAGRSLKETEIREKNLAQMALMAWICAMVVIGIHWLMDMKVFKAGY